MTVVKESIAVGCRMDIALHSVVTLDLVSKSRLRRQNRCGKNSLLGHKAALNQMRRQSDEANESEEHIKHQHINTSFRSTH